MAKFKNYYEMLYTEYNILLYSIMHYYTQYNALCFITSLNKY